MPDTMPELCRDYAGAKRDEKMNQNLTNVIGIIFWVCAVAQRGDKPHENYLYSSLATIIAPYTHLRLVKLRDIRYIPVSTNF